MNLASCMILLCFGCNIFSAVSYYSYLSDDDADIFAVTLVRSYCNFPFLIISSMIMTVLRTSYNRFFRKRNGLYDGRVVSMTKNKHGSAVNFLYSSIKSL